MNFIVIMFILKYISCVSANGPGTIFVYLISYQNPSGKTDSGSDCDSWFKQFVQDKCDLVFSICLKDAEIKNSKYPCNVGSISTLNNVFHNTLRVKFDSNIGFIPNPFNFTLRSMPSNLKIRINITDDDITGQQLISQMVHVIQLPIIGVDEDVSSINQIILSSMTSEMILKVYGRCNKNYYGPGCNEFCRPSVSVDNGFYACDKISGQKHCLIGWTGNDCRQRDLCILENPCHGSASCTMNDSLVNCICPESLTGKFCEIPRRPCDSSPCVNGGLCVRNPYLSSVINSETICICPRNFTGKQCQKDFDECTMYTCKNEASCVNSFGSYICVCKNNHWGVNCEKPPVFSVKGIDSSFLIKSSTARFMQTMITILLIFVVGLICIIGLLSFLYCKNRSKMTLSQSIGSIYSECHFDDKPTHLTDLPNEEDIHYTNYYELENDNCNVKNEDNLKMILTEDKLKCYEKESVI